MADAIRTQPISGMRAISRSFRPPNLFIRRLEIVHSRLRSPAVALVGAVAVSATAVAMSPARLTTVKRNTAEISLRSGSDIALIMGGTGMPDPTQAYIDEVNDFFLQPNFPGYEPVGLQTPEEAFPIYGLLSGYESVAQGVADLNTAITQTYAGDNLVIFGVSQSAMIASLEEQQLAANPPADLGQLHFALLAGPDNPMGGLFERFAGLDNPVVNYDLYPPSPTDLFPTDIYTGEYDGVSDFPDDLSNLLSVANAPRGHGVRAPRRLGSHDGAGPISRAAGPIRTDRLLHDSHDGAADSAAAV
jgi:PE-PPE domain